MLSIPGSVSIYVHTRPTDLRKSFDGLCGNIRNEFGREPLDGRLGPPQSQFDGQRPLMAGGIRELAELLQQLPLDLEAITQPATEFQILLDLGRHGGRSFHDCTSPPWGHGNASRASRSKSTLV
jgi:hypothetical protein